MKKKYSCPVLLLCVSLLLGGCTQTERIPQDTEKAAHDEGWFADCMLIGDSRLVGMILYTGIAVGADYTYNGFTAAAALHTACVETAGGTVTVPQAIAAGDSFAKCCILLGVNDAGWQSEAVFRSQYEELIADVRAKSPQCDIYLLGEYSIFEAYIETTGGALTPAKIKSFNDIVKDIAAQQSCTYIDLFTPFADADGYLLASASSDGLHMTPQACRDMLQLILNAVA